MHTGPNTSWLLVQSTAGAVELTVEKVRNLATEGINSSKTVRNHNLDILAPVAPHRIRSADEAEPQAQL